MTTMARDPAAIDDKWEKISKSYLRMVGETTIAAAKVLLRSANELLPFSRATYILDNGCGPGPVMSQLLSEYGAQIDQSCKLQATDFSPAMMNQVQACKDHQMEPGNAIWQRLQLSVQDAQAMEGISDNSVSHVVSGFLYMLLPNPMTALRATRRILREDGLLALTCWKEAQWMDSFQLMNEVKLGSYRAPLPTVWTTTEGAIGELRKAGFRDVNCIETTVRLEVSDPDLQAKMFVEQIPGVVKVVQHFTEVEKTELLQLMSAQIKDYREQNSGYLRGTALVVLGWK